MAAAPDNFDDFNISVNLDSSVVESIINTLDESKKLNEDVMKQIDEFKQDISSMKDSLQEVKTLIQNSQQPRRRGFFSFIF
jgi:hypothetical protein